MDDDCKEYRKNKPQQKFYKPGSGPLRRSSYGLDTKMDVHDSDNSGKRYRSNYGSQYSINDDLSDAHSEHSVSNIRHNHKKPEQQLYMPRSGDSEVDKSSRTTTRYDSSSHYNSRSNPDKHGLNSSSGYNRGSKRDRTYYGGYQNKAGGPNDINYNRSYRQSSETRSISPSHSVQEQKLLDRNRDSKSMETSAGRHMSSSGGKPPSGRRNSAGYISDTSRPKYMVNLDNIPPRFRKKFLEQSAHQSVENMEQACRDKSSSNYSLQPTATDDHVYSSNSNWSHTLPSRGRGRLRDHEGFDRDKFINSYLKTYEQQNSRQSTPSSSYINLYESSNTDQGFVMNKPNPMTRSIENKSELVNAAQQNGLNNVKVQTPCYSETQNYKQEAECEPDNETSQVSTTLLDLTNLDWSEEVEKNIQLDDTCDTSTSFSQNLKKSNAEELKPQETKESKRSGRSRRKDRRSSSRGVRNVEKKERNRKDSTASVQHDTECSRKDSNVSLQNDLMSLSLRRRERERRDSYRSNRSSTIGNSRDDLDRWRSLRSYSREQSTEGRIVSQCNSRDTSVGRALSPRDSDGFRVPSVVNKPAAWSSTCQKSSASGNGRTSSVERGRQSPATVSGTIAGGGVEGGGGRRPKRRTGRRRARLSEQSAAAPTPGAAPPPVAHAAAPATHASHAAHATHALHSTHAAPLSWREEIIESKRHSGHDKYTENPSHRNASNSGATEKSESSNHYPGLIMLPQGSIGHLQKDFGRNQGTENQKTLYDHQNPSKPIIVQTSPTKVDLRMERGVKEASSRNAIPYEGNEAARAARHRSLLQEVDRADVILQAHMLKGPVGLADHWADLADTRTFLQNALQRLLMSDLKFCQADNIEHQFWKILYYNFIEILRKSFPQISPEDKPKIVQLINVIIEEGNTFFENLVQMLEKAYKFNVDDYLNDSHALPPKGLGYVGLALISVQKLYVYLGDLARYKEQVNETNNYAKSKLWYTKAQQINPKNGRPYNQLAILAIYARRKLDAVYYYMRSLMSSNPLQSARESLLSLFDENRKKYEAAERKRRAVVESGRSGDAERTSDARPGGAGLSGGAAGACAGAGGGAGGGAGADAGGELWLRPGERRASRDSRAAPPRLHDALSNMTSVELNKNFITSYLHVHGKLITKIGMETFYECASLMLRQFRALLHRQPLPLPAARLLHLTALNMFAVETTAAPLRDGSSGGERSAWLECALGVSLLMFGALVERCCALLPEPQHTQHHADALTLLPAIKVWSDWMLCHSSIWNPPPTFDNFETESENDPWDWLAKLMNILEKLDDKSIQLETEPKEGEVCVRLAEDASLGGFTPLMYMEPAAAYCAPAAPLQRAEHALRTRKLLFFGTEYLVGVEPPVLRLECPAEAPPRYVSAVQRAQPHHAPLRNLTEASEDESSVSEAASLPASSGDALESAGADEATRSLLRRKEQLETRKATIERHRQRMQEILRTSSVDVAIEVRPRWLVPDTNCFIDHLDLIRAIATAPSQPYTLAVPLVVLTELEGLRKCSRVGGAAREALSWVTGGAGGAVRLATTRGSLLASRAFTAERDHERATNDDRVLATALNLHSNMSADAGACGARVEQGGGEPGALRVREVVLLTDDRNLRVKALAAELPTRDLPSFVQWAGLYPEDIQKSQSVDDDTAKRK